MVTISAPGPFLTEVMAETPDGHRLRNCIQCGTCGGSCPNGAEMDMTPRALFAHIVAGDRELVLGANTMWQCVSCYFCTSRCPQEIPITDLMYTLKRMAIREGKASDPEAPALSRVFTEYVEKYGRSFEAGIATRYHLLRHPVQAMRMGSMGLALLRRGRMSLTPHRIREIGQLETILDKAREIGGRQ